MYMCQIETRTQYSRRGDGESVGVVWWGGLLEEGGREGVWSCQPKDKPKLGLGDFQ